MMDNSEKKSNASVVGTAMGVLVLVAASVVGGWVACDLWPKEDPKIAPPPQQKPSVAVMPVAKRTYNLPERFVAHAEPVQEVELLPQVDGYIKEILFKEGDIVKAGDVLYVLDGERYEAIVNQRKADLAAAEAEERRSIRYWERMRKADARGVTELERDNAEAGAQSAKAAVMQAKANLIVAEYDLKKTRVIAPISGQIGKTSAHVGDYVSPSKGALARIVQVDPMRVSFPLTDRAYVSWRNARLKGKAPDYRMRLVLPDGSEYHGEGKWAFDDNTMSKDTATIIMRLEFPNPDRLLVPNTYVTLLVDDKAPPEIPCVPQQAVMDLPSGDRALWVLRDDMTVEQRVVTVGEMSKGFMPVYKGVSTGEKVVISGVSKLATGMAVMVVEPTDNDDLNPEYKSPVKD
ncbi:MAG: efflux RND transporter periplasmic adaptor subunit [Kiritimatiellae bacterium]|nr:efflux RND transporter periplasmic adaptor subunit [Kiritimatiellia bacterium]